MARKAITAVGANVERLQAAIDQLDRRAEKMEVVLMVREPGSMAAAEAYDGLRKQVVSVAAERMAHLSQLVQFESALRNRADHAVLSKMVDGWLEASGLSTVTDPNHPDCEFLFELVEDLGGDLKVLEPAYVDMVTGRIVRRGRAQRVQTDQPPTVGSPPVFAHAGDEPSLATSDRPEAEQADGTRDSAQIRVDLTHGDAQ